MESCASQDGVLSQLSLPTKPTPSSPGPWITASRTLRRCRERGGHEGLGQGGHQEEADR